jgi:hypothetical protein
MTSPRCMSQSCLHTACTVLGPLLTFLGFFAPSQGTPTSPQERFNAPVLKTKMAPRGIVAFLLDPRTEPNKTEAFRIKKWQNKLATENGETVCCRNVAKSLLVLVDDEAPCVDLRKAKEPYGLAQRGLWLADPYARVLADRPQSPRPLIILSCAAQPRSIGKTITTKESRP